MIAFDIIQNNGLFVNNSVKTIENINEIKRLSEAALQSQKAEFSDIIKIMRSESIQEAEEFLLLAEQKRTEIAQQQQQSQLKAQQESEEKMRAFRREEWQYEMDKIKLEQELQTERELQKQTIMTLGFNENKDVDKDGELDSLEVYKAGLDADIKKSKQDLERDKLEQKKLEHREKMELEKRKLQIANNKKNNA